MAAKRKTENGNVFYLMDVRLTSDAIAVAKKHRGYQLERDWYAAAIDEFAANPSPILAIPSRTTRKLVWIPSRAALKLRALARAVGAEYRETFYTAAQCKFMREKESPPGDGESESGRNKHTNPEFITYDKD